MRVQRTRSSPSGPERRFQKIHASVARSVYIPRMRVRAASFFAAIALSSSAAALAGAGVWTTNGPPGGAGSVVADPHVPGIVYAGNMSGLFRSADNGATWTSTGLSGGGGYVPLAAGATVYATGAAGLLASHDQGAHWTLLLPGLFGGSYMLTRHPLG